jgi:hypothetical protein
MLLLSVVGSAVFTGLLLCVRRFDAENGTEGDEGGGGGSGHRPGPDRPGPVAVPDPPLGEIRATRRRPSAEREKKAAVP